jgi:Lar family restriction alleviation protein
MPPILRQLFKLVGHATPYQGGTSDLVDEPLILRGVENAFGNVSIETRSVSPLLQPCPFCGSNEAELEAELSPPDPIAWARCNACGANGPSAYSVPEAVACWNRALRWSQE